MTDSRTHYYPVSLDLHLRPCVVIGGGRLAEEKIPGLLEAGACLTVISPSLSPPLAELATGKGFRHLERRYRRGDLGGAFLAISTLSDDGVNQEIWQEAWERRLLLNVMDDTPRCGFIAASILRRGDLTVAVSTSGSAPALAVRLRQWLEGRLGEEYAEFLDLARRLRAPLARRFPSFQERRRRWYRLVDSDVLERLCCGDDDAALERIEEIMGVEPTAIEGGPP